MGIPVGLGAFASGLSGGLDAGTSLAERIRRQQEDSLLRKAQAAAGQAMTAPNLQALSPQPQPPMPGQPSVPGGSGGMSPDPMMTARPMPPSMGPSAGTPQPLAASKPDPNAPPAGTMAGPATGPAGGQPMSGTAAPSGQPGLQGSILDANNTIKSIAQSIKASNPGIDPRALFLATQQTIEQMKGVRSEVKDYMQAQIEYARMQARHEDEQARNAERMQEIIRRMDEADKVSKERAAAQRDVAKTQAGARVQAAGIGAAARESAAATGAGARVQAAEIGAGSREKVADITSRARAASDATKGRTARDVARINMGKDPATTPPVKGAQKAPDGNWYVKRGNQFYRVEQ